MFHVVRDICEHRKTKHGYFSPAFLSLTSPTDIQTRRLMSML